MTEKCKYNVLCYSGKTMKMNYVIEMHINLSTCDS